MITIVWRGGVPQNTIYAGAGSSVSWRGGLPSQTLVLSSAPPNVMLLFGIKF